MRLDGFGLFVDDIANMIRFYRDVLGFEIKEGEDTSNLIEIGSFNKHLEVKAKYLLPLVMSTDKGKNKGKNQAIKCCSDQLCVINDHLLKKCR